MLGYYSALLLTVAASVFYHIVQKSTPAEVNPIVSIAVSYSVAIGLCLVAYPFVSAGADLAPAVRKLNWTSYALGFAIFGIELGFLLAYRAGWDISLANILSAVAVALILIAVGFAAFNEQLTLVKGLGVLLCLAGIALIK